jgi:hypothetical protein
MSKEEFDLLFSTTNKIVFIIINEILFYNYCNQNHRQTIVTKKLVYTKLKAS